MPRIVVTFDAAGQHRSGPAGAWWSNLEPRPGTAGFSPEIPVGRARAWNVSLVGVVGVAAVLTHFLARVPRPQIGAVLGGAVLLGVFLGVLAYRAARYRDPWQRFLREQAQADARAAHPTARTRLALARRTEGAA